MSALLEKGGNKALKDIGISDFFTVSVNWKTDNTLIDIDVSAFLLDENEKVSNDEGFIFYNQLRSRCSSVTLKKMTQKQSDFDINTAKIPSNVKKIVFVISAQIDTKPAKLGQIDNVTIALIDNNKECVIYQLSGLINESSVTMGELYRHNGEFKFRAVGQGFNEGLAKLAEYFGVVIDSNDSAPEIAGVTSREIIDDPINSHFRVINESIGIARKSKNRDTQLSRLSVAADCLKRARSQSSRLSVDISGFDEAEAEIKRIFDAINAGTPTEIVGMQHIDIDAEYSSEARTLLKQATELKKEKKYIEACEKLRAAYSADGSGSLMIEERLRLPMYLQLAERNDEGWNELNCLLQKYDDQFSKPVIKNQMRIFLKKENNETATSPVRVTFNENSNNEDEEKKGLFKTISSFFKAKPVTEAVRTVSISDLHDSSIPEWIADIVVGLEFSATLQLRTPIRVLSRVGEIYAKNDGKQPKIAVEGWEGIWCAKLKPFSELGMKEPRKQISASDIGYVIYEKYLPFLIDIRKIVELNDTIDNRIYKLFNHPHTNEWMCYVNKHGGLEELSKYFFPLFLDTIPKLNNESVKQLKELGLETPNAISHANDDMLLNVNGIGKAKLKTIRDYCVGTTENLDNKRVDAVKR